jgi:lysophospholipase L1-like esterase
VGAVGDSLLGQLQSEGPTHPRSARAFTLSLNDHGWRASVKHRNAWPVSRIRLLAQQSRDRGAEVVIVVAGSGNVRQVRESPEPRAARQAMVRSIRNLLADLGDACVVWPTLHLTGGAGERQTARALNRELSDAEEGDPDVRSPDWATLAASHPGWFIGDGVHLSPRGEAAFQQILLGAADRCVESLE